MAQKAVAIITDSKNSKKDIIKILKYPSHKIFVVPLAVNEKYKQLKKLGISKKYSLPKDFLLYVGDLNWNKNLKALIKTFKNIKKRYKN